MKCGCYVSRTFTPGGKPRKPDVVTWMAIRDLSPYPKEDQWTVDNLLKAGFVKCEGTINVEVYADNVPDWGRTFAQLNVNYECAECHNSYFPELPSADNLSYFLTQLFALERMDGDEMRKIHITKLREQEDIRAEMVRQAALNKAARAEKKTKKKK